MTPRKIKLARKTRRSSSVIRKPPERRPSPNHLAMSTEERVCQLVLNCNFPIGYALSSTYFEIAKSWETRARSSGWTALLQDLTVKGISNSSSIVLRASSLANERRCGNWPVDVFRREAALLDDYIIHHFYFILEGGEVSGLPSVQCIRSKLPKNRAPTEEELRRAFQECAKQS